MNGVALAFAVLALTGSPGDLGIVLAAQSASMVATLLVSGVFADRFPRRSLMVAADTARLLSRGTTATLLITGHAEIWHLVLLQVVHGTASGVFAPATVGLIPTIVASEHLRQGNALRSLALSLGSTVGPALAGVLSAATSPGWALAVDAGTYAVSVATLALLRPPPRRLTQSQPFIRELLAGPGVGSGGSSL
jgi:MFS family permease